VVDGVEIKLPDDVPVNRAVVDRYLAHAKEVGLTPKQIQAEIDFQTQTARETMKAQPKAKSQQEIEAEQDAANVALLKADKEFGSKYDENMEIARRAAVKFGDKELLGRLRTSDPVLVRHFWKLGLADVEDSTRGAPNRNGIEDEQSTQQEHLKSRYPNSPTMFRA
jgi:hypothetical protein